ncbi:MAG: pentapeptide repeat-containing protein [Rhizomicrobium sp.]
MLKNLYGGDLVARSQAELNTILAAHERYALYQGGQRAQLAHADLSGLNLANRKLMEADFSGAALVGANLYGSNLERASLYCADLRNCNLQLANLVRADLRGASFKDARLSYAVLDQADLRSTMMTYSIADAVAERARQTTAGMNASPQAVDPGVDFSHCSLKGVSFGNAKLSGVNFTDALLQGANFKNARLTNVTFTGAVLTGVNLRELVVPAGALDGCVLDVAPGAQAKIDIITSQLDAHRLWLASDGKKGIPAILDGEDLRPLRGMLTDHELAGLSAKKTNCIGLDFSGSQLQAAKFDGADLRDVDFSGCDLRGVSFRGAKLAHAKFERAILKRLRLTNGTTLAPDFTGADGSERQFSGAILEDDLGALGLLEHPPA